ncbi:MAG: hypothetical protein JWM68_1427 [Verrucomicrobiales bacterium]|nr:hypothetical protein [Verrucomicrobiales bacterium]
MDPRWQYFALKMPQPVVEISKSKLLPIGVLLMLFGIMGRAPLVKAVSGMEQSGLRNILLLVAGDGLAILGLAGITCTLLGWLRNRNSQRLQKKSAAQPLDT